MVKLVFRAWTRIVSALKHVFRAWGREQKSAAPASRARFSSVDGSGFLRFRAGIRFSSVSPTDKNPQKRKHFAGMVRHEQPLARVTAQRYRISSVERIFDAFFWRGSFFQRGKCRQIVRFRRLKTVRSVEDAFSERGCRHAMRALTYFQRGADPEDIVFRAMSSEKIAFSCCFAIFFRPKPARPSAFYPEKPHRLSFSARCTLPLPERGSTFLQREPHVA